MPCVSLKMNQHQETSYQKKNSITKNLKDKNLEDFFVQTILLAVDNIQRF